MQRTSSPPAVRLGALAIAVLAALAALVIAVPAQAAGAGKPGAGKPVKYEGKTSSGHKITFTLKEKHLYNMESGISVSCVSIQGGGPPTGGVETFSYNGAVRLSPTPVEFVFMKKPSVYYNEVTTTHQLASKIVNHRTGLITGTQRIQYSFLIPKYPIGTFGIYSCLGEGSFRAKPVAPLRGGKRR